MAAHNFQGFIVSILRDLNLTRETIKKCTEGGNLGLFQQAFTHKSYDTKVNYEFLEMHGDAVVNAVGAQYIVDRFPDVTSGRWLTRIEHNITGKQDLARLAEQAGFYHHILFNRNDRSLTSRYSVDRMSMLEDVFEAFTGVLSQTVDKLVRRGVGYDTAFTFVSGRFHTLPISLKVEDIFDPISRLKEVYDNQALKWPFSKKTVIKTWRTGGGGGRGRGGRGRGGRGGRGGGEGFFVTSIRGGLQHQEFVVGRDHDTRAPTEEGSQKKAITHAIEFLYKKHGVQESYPNPFEKGEPLDIEPAGDFVDFIRGLFEDTGVSEGKIKLFTQPNYIHVFFRSFIDPSYNAINNHDVLKFEGVRIIDLFIVEYMRLNYPEVQSEKTLSTIKHNIMRGKDMNIIAEKMGLEKFVVVGNIDGIERTDGPSPKIVANTLKAFIGAITHVIDEATSHRGVGYAVVFRILSRFFLALDIQIAAREIYNETTQLAELYRKRKWGTLKEVTDFEQDPITKIFTVNVYGFPRGRKVKMMLGTGTGTTKKGAEREAAMEALGKLKRKYRIYEVEIERN